MRVYDCLFSALVPDEGAQAVALQAPAPKKLFSNEVCILKRIKLVILK